jgi:hypothetical protein
MRTLPAVWWQEWGRRAVAVSPAEASAAPGGADVDEAARGNLSATAPKVAVRIFSRASTSGSAKA